MKSTVHYLINEDGCWIWQRAISGGTGYGVMQHNGKLYPSHRVYYEKYNGSIPEKHEIDHLCRVRACVNPEHLEAVTHAINVRRGKLTKLTQGDIDVIRVLKMTNKNIAKIFGVSAPHISKIMNKKKWKYTEYHPRKEKANP